MLSLALSPQHYRVFTEQTVGPMIKLVEMLSVSDPAKLAEFRREYGALVTEYFHRQLNTAGLSDDPRKEELRLLYGSPICSI